MADAIAIPLKRKYTKDARQAKGIKNTKVGNGKRAKSGKVSWKAGTGQGDRKG